MIRLRLNTKRYLEDDFNTYDDWYSTQFSSTNKHKVKIQQVIEYDDNPSTGYFQATKDEAERAAQQASRENPNDIFFVAYEDFMYSDPNKQFYYKGKAYKSADDALRVFNRGNKLHRRRSSQAQFYYM